MEKSILHSKKCRKNKIQTLAEKYGKRLLDLENIDKICKNKKNFIPYIQAYPWETTSLTHGLPGLICLFTELEIQTQDPIWANATHSCIKKILYDLKEKGVNHEALSSGLSGICFAISIASMQGQRYNNLILKLHSFLLSMLEDKLYDLACLQNTATAPLNPLIYDYIAGLSGVLSYLLASITKKNSEKYIVFILAFLTKLSSNSENLFCSPEYIIREEERKNFPSGYFDTGFAHGITGVLTVLSKALLMGYEVDGQKVAIRMLVEQMKSLQTTFNDFQDVWVPKITKSTQKQGTIAYRDGWCYGRPGISYSLLQASLALKDSVLKQYSIDTMASCIQTNYSNLTVTCHSLCHGLSGLLVASHIFYKVTEKPIFSEAAEYFSNLIESRENSNFAFGFKSLVFGNNTDLLWIDNPGLLDGTSGTLLSLLTLTREKDDFSSFTRIFFP